MRATGIGLLATCMLLCGCQQSPAAAGPKSQGRFAGIGMYDAGKLWAQMTGSGSTKDAAAATIADDEHVIVVLDSHTGEVRQCGDHSGYCVTMNPWTGPRAALPVKLARHAADDQAEALNATDAR